ncbi:hypothetical protein [Leifsonia sp. fls2-241-R2A-40a]|uniref:hypothetical protein n=1 Tax=Leifsonia sp. fls2-241-R2A-40a TaxID=3040290 RepID=UPI00255140FB|nr:hypothetical protein [Leifsonia sp. fls2-241-R2A-40a]
MVLLGLTVAGCASQSEPKPTPLATHHTATATPTAPSAPSTEDTAADTTPKLGVLPDAMKKYQAESLDDFASEDEPTRLAYWAALFGGMDNIRDFADDAYRVSQDPRDKLPATITVNSSPQEILTVTAVGERLPFALSGTDRQKAAMAILEHSRGSNRWDVLDAALKADPEGMTGGSVAYQSIVTNADLISATDPATLPGVTQVYRDITLKGTNGQPTTTRCFYHDVQYNGQTFGWWVEN